MSNIRGSVAAAPEPDDRPVDEIECGSDGGDDSCCAHADGAEEDCCCGSHEERADGGHDDHAGAGGCACCGGDADDDEKMWGAPFIIGVVLFAAGFIFENFGHSIVGAFTSGAAMESLLRWGPAAVLLISYLLIGRHVLTTAFKNILRGRVFDENFLMTIASIGAFVIGEYPEAVAVMLFYEVGEYFQGRAVRHSRKSISALLDIRPDTANIQVDGEIKEIAAERVNVGDVILIRPGDKVPLDGTVVSGNSSMDTKALTGESLPTDVGEGDTVLSGSINGQGLLNVRVTKRFSESTASKIIDLVEHAGTKKAKTENFITVFARYYTPAVVAIAAALAILPPILGAGTFADWVYRGLVFLVVSCPCALVISIPISFFGGIGASSARGILVKGGNYLEALNRVDTVIFDKTGTLTAGAFRVTAVMAAEGVREDRVLRIAAGAESSSTHPIAVSIIEKFREVGGEIDLDEIGDIVEKPGFGVRARVKDDVVLVGNTRLMDEEDVSYPRIETAGTMVCVAVNGQYTGMLLVADEVKADSRKTVDGLRRRGIGRVLMFTGDNAATAAKIGAELGLDDCEAGLLPHRKVEALERVLAEKAAAEPDEKKRGKTVFVGDGINDAPVLARADVGFAMGGLGSDAAIEAADIVIMNDEPSKILTALDIAKKTKKIVWENIGFALGIKAVVLALAAVGIANMWEAVFADVGVALLATLNALRAGRVDG
ncbi:MAG: cadmium-translocating P-type ATPase [Clostridiales Family XIII bacterium]|nr:cadmium-translocating P-type ATPase [Clostridiales Family XIII bacterium]